MKNKEVTHSVLTQFIGVIWSTVIGGVYSLIYIITLDLTGWRNLWIKAIIIVNGTWLLGAGFMMRLLNITTFTRTEPLSIFAFYLAHMLFATYLFLLVKSLGEQHMTNNLGKKWPIKLCRLKKINTFTRKTKIINPIKIK